jgi:hypothetical protein
MLDLHFRSRHRSTLPPLPTRPLGGRRGRPTHRLGSEERTAQGPSNFARDAARIVGVRTCCGTFPHVVSLR